MSATQQPHGTTAHAHPELSFVKKDIFSDDHKNLGIQFLNSTLIFLAVGGVLPLMVRMKLGWFNGELPVFSHICQSNNGGRMQLKYYNVLFSRLTTVIIYIVINTRLADAF